MLDDTDSKDLTSYQDLKILKCILMPCRVRNSSEQELSVNRQT